MMLHFYCPKNIKIRWFKYKNLSLAFKQEALQFLRAKKPCRKLLATGSSSCYSNMNCKVQTQLQDHGHPQVCHLLLTMKNLMLKVSNKSYSQLKIQKLSLFSKCHLCIKLKVIKWPWQACLVVWQMRSWLVVVLEKGLI